MKAILITLGQALIAFAIGFYFGRYPLMQRRFFSYWARRREAMRRDY